MSCLAVGDDEGDDEGDDNAEMGVQPMPGLQGKSRLAALTTGNADNVQYLGGRDPKGNPVRFAKQSGHVSNYDEDKVHAYSLPDPLKMADGRTVATAEEWKARRAEILTFYEAQIYGRVPENAPTVTWKVVETDENARGGAVITKKIEGTVGSASDGSAPKLRVTLHVPKQANGRIPVLLKLSFFSGEFPRGRRGSNDGPRRSIRSPPFSRMAGRLRRLVIATFSPIARTSSNKA